MYYSYSYMKVDFFVKYFDFITIYNYIFFQATGRKVPICEFNGIDFLDGSKFTTTGCNECECKKGHLHCCG